jgi:hypothetical protein
VIYKHVGVWLVSKRVGGDLSVLRQHKPHVCLISPHKESVMTHTQVTETNNPTMAADDDITEDNSNNVDVILSYKPLAPDSAVSSNPHVPSVSASAVLGESESVRREGG